MIIHQKYLGDGAYVQEGNYKGEVILFLFDGLTETRHIHLDFAAVEALQNFVSFIKEVYQERSKEAEESNVTT